MRGSLKQAMPGSKTAMYRAVFDTPQGQRVLSDICKHSFVFDSTFVRGDSHETSLNEGARRLALSILRILRKDMRELMKLNEELEEEGHAGRSNNP